MSSYVYKLLFLVAIISNSFVSHATTVSFIPDTQIHIISEPAIILLVVGMIGLSTIRRK